MKYKSSTFFKALIVLTALLAFATGTSFAQNTKNLTPTEPELREYVNQRWLNGNSTAMLSALEYLIYQIPVNGMQISLSKKFSEGENAQIVSEFKAHIKNSGVDPLTKAEAQQQFVRWGDCLVKEYRSSLAIAEMEKLQTYIGSGIFQYFPRLRRFVEGWDFIAMQRVSGLIGSTKVFAGGGMPHTEEDQRRFELMYLAVADPIQNIFMAQFINQSQMNSVRDELFGMGMNLKAASISLGIGAPAWTSMESYSLSNLPSREEMFFRSCHNNPQYVTKPMTSWNSSASAGLVSFFDPKMKELSKK